MTTDNMTTMLQRYYSMTSVTGNDPAMVQHDSMTKREQL
jgi:hypothetical protein